MFSQANVNKRCWINKMILNIDKKEPMVLNSVVPNK